MLSSSGILLHMWFYFALFALMIVVLVWFLEYAYVTMYFNQLKIQDMTRIGREIIRSPEMTNEEIDQRAMDNNVAIIIFSLDNQTIKYASGVSPGNFDIRLITYAVSQIDINVMPYEYYTRVTRGKLFARTSEVSDLVYCSVGTKVGVYITSHEFSLSGNTSILAQQLFIVTLVSLFVAFVISGFLSVRMSKPILEMSGQARKLATGDYNVVFESNSYTELNELSDALNYATKQLSKTDKVRRDLVANVSHDLKTPLTLIISYAELIRDLSGDNKEKRDKDLNVIIDEANRLTDLVNEMLKASKLEDADTNYDLTRINISDLIIQVFDHFEIKVTKGYTFELHVEPDLFIIADHTKLEQAVYNMFSNAVNYVGKDKWIGISLFRNNGNIRFEISDHGAGISADEIDNIWDKYYQSSDKAKRSNGTGLGLNIVKTVLTRHNATYGVNSVVGEGSCFFFEIKEVK